jgi:hypothetical protein
LPTFYGHIAKVLQSQQAAARDRTRQTDLRGNIGQGAARALAIERAQYLQTTVERLDVIRTINERPAQHHGRRLQ